MKKIILALPLILSFAIFASAGDTPAMGYSGCPGGAWYPDSQVCCMPNQECPAGRSASATSNNVKDSILFDLITLLKNVYF